MEGGMWCSVPRPKAKWEGLQENHFVHKGNWFLLPQLEVCLYRLLDDFPSEPLWAEEKKSKSEEGREETVWLWSSSQAHNLTRQSCSMSFLWVIQTSWKKSHVESSCKQQGRHTPGVSCGDTAWSGNKTGREELGSEWIFCKNPSLHRKRTTLPPQNQQLEA